jgi:membrane protease YdiL (CAAX protease family)
MTIDAIDSLAARGTARLRGACPRGPDDEKLAPAWHSARLIALMVAVAVAGTVLSHVSLARDVAGAARALAAPPSASRVVTVYLPLLLVEWGLLFYVCRIGRAGWALRALLGPSWGVRQRVPGDVAIALSGFVLIEASALLAAHFETAPASALTAMLPHTPVERVAWMLVAVSAGFCEEVVYRGYLQLQLAAFTGRPLLAIALQALLFGMAHGEQGLASGVRVAVYGLLLGFVARWRRSLLPGILCHVAVDAFAVLGR